MRKEQAIKALISSYGEGKLFPGSSCNCAIASILNESVRIHGVSHGLMTKWFSLIAKFSTDRLSREDYIAVSQLEALTGFSIEELKIIEETFEGGSISLGRRRLSLSKDISLEDRIINVINKIKEMDNKISTNYQENRKPLEIAW